MNHFKTLALVVCAALAGTQIVVAQNLADYLRQKTKEKKYDGYRNPVIPGYHPDPSAICVGEDFYLINSTFQYFPGVPIYHSKDLVIWEQIGNVVTDAEAIALTECGASGGIFAPTLRYHEGKYYMITTNINLLYKGQPGTFILTADNPAGPWSKPVFTAGVRGIDPDLFWDEDGRCYCCYSAMDHINMFEINIETGEPIGENRGIWNGCGDSSPEGPHLFRKDGYYYLLIAEGGTEMGHKVNIARSKNIWGPYDGCPSNPILTQKSAQGAGSMIQGTGHPDLVQAPDGSWWMVGLCFRTTAGKQLHTLGRETFLAPVRWDEGAWPVVNAKGMIEEEMDVPTLPLVPFSKPTVRTAFKNGSKLGFEWVYIANPKTENYSIQKNQLKLKATAVTLDDPTKTPTAVFRRQEDLKLTVTTQLSLSDAKAGDCAGLTVYMDPHGHYDVVLVAQADGSQAVQLRYRLGQMLHVEKTVPVKSKSVQFRVDADAKNYTFLYSTDGGKKFEKLATMDSFLLATETMGGFTGMMLGLFAEGKEGASATAAFDWFDYDGQDPKN